MDEVHHWDEIRTGLLKEGLSCSRILQVYNSLDPNLWNIVEIE